MLQVASTTAIEPESEPEEPDSSMPPNEGEGEDDDDGEEEVAEPAPSPAAETFDPFASFSTAPETEAAPMPSSPTARTSPPRAGASPPKQRLLNMMANLDENNGSAHKIKCLFTIAELEAMFAASDEMLPPLNLY